MRFFTYRKEEAGALSQFRDACVKDRLEIVVSRKAIAAMHKIATAKGSRMPTTSIGTSNCMTLGRRGLIREENDGMWVVTELGLLCLAYAQAGGLLSVPTVEPLKVERAKLKAMMANKKAKRSESKETPTEQRASA